MRFWPLLALPGADADDGGFFEFADFAPIPTGVGDDVGLDLSDEEAVSVEVGEVFQLSVEAIVELLFGVEGGVHELGADACE